MNTHLKIPDTIRAESETSDVGDDHYGGDNQNSLQNDRGQTEDSSSTRAEQSEPSTQHDDQSTASIRAESSERSSFISKVSKVSEAVSRGAGSMRSVSINSQREELDWDKWEGCCIDAPYRHRTGANACQGPECAHYDVAEVPLKADASRTQTVSGKIHVDKEGKISNFEPEFPIGKPHVAFKE